MIQVWEGLTDSPSWWDVLSGLHGQLMFDIGANVGQAATLFAKSFDRVVSCEPCAEAYEILAERVPENVTVLEHAVSDHTGTVTLAVNSGSIRTGQLTSGECSEPAMGWGEVVGWRTVPAVTVDEMVRTFGIPDHVKVDTEGHELAVLAGASLLIARRETAWYIEVHSRRFASALRDHFAGYRVTFVDHDYAPAPFDNYYMRAVPA